ncbi:MAG: hypothetical protein ABJP45_00630 [Cyclobacteriaceae bacterium]
MSRVGLLVIFLSVSTSLFGQSSDQPISISFENETLENALLELDKVVERQLSYNPQILPTGVVVNQSFEGQSPENVLTAILGSAYQLKNIGDYIIIQKVPLVKKEKSTFQLTGGIKDAATGLDLEDVSIYEINSLQSTLSDKLGEFSLKSETNLATATFVISKRFYEDTIIQVSNLEPYVAPIVLKKEEQTKPRIAIRERVRTFSSGLAKFFTSDKVRTNASNVNFVDTRMFQFSLVPAIGTNRKLSSQIKNKASLNLIAGYTYGVDGVEIGGVYNISRGEVWGVQVGGFGNTVGGEVHGLQMGGFINTSKDYVKGAQIAGFINVASDSVNGFQMGGFTNLTREMSGIQVAGFNNHTKRMNGFQLSGFINTTQEMDGFQLTGFINIAKEVKGLQLSVINVSDTVASGIPFGLFNIVKKNGFISPAIESDDLVPYRLAFRSGLEKFYTVLSAGIDPDDHWTFGAGFGSRLFPLKEKKFFLNPELRWINAAEGSGNQNENNTIIRFGFNLGYQLFKHLSITTGPTLNYYYTNHLDESQDPVISLARNPIVDEVSGKFRHQLWIGYSIGIGF